MRDLPTGLAERLESGAASLCHAWIVTLKDGARLGFTDHDRALEVAGVTCSAASGWTAGAADAEVGLEGGSASAAGVLDHESVDEAELAAGRWDGAQVELWRVDWSAPELRVRLWTGTVSRLVRQGEGFTAEIEGPLAALRRVAGRTYGRLCDAALGDPRCGVDLQAHPGASCDKRFATCRDQFANAVNFRGFPDMPGDDFLAVVPGAGERHDGSSRR